MNKAFRWAAATLALLCLQGTAEETLTREQIMTAEQALYELGYHDRSFDAQLDESTRSAIYNFQVANGLAATGELDSTTYSLLEQGGGVTCHDYLIRLNETNDALMELQNGSTGDAVVQLQRRLTELGCFSGSTDGVFGDATRMAVCRFQFANGLKVSGRADRATLIRLYAEGGLSWPSYLEFCAGAPGDAGSGVRRLQSALAALGYYTGAITGIYGENTRQAVLHLQRDNGLEETGSADPSLCALLFDSVLTQDTTLRRGSSGDIVSTMQLRLSELGYFQQDVTGVYGVTTETAVRLFQIASGLPATGEADAQTQSLIDADGAVPANAAADTFNAQLQSFSADRRTQLAMLADALRGTSFQSGDEDYNAGFSFIQYLCAAVELPVLEPSALLACMVETNRRPDAFPAGTIVKLDRGSGPSILAVATGRGTLIYATMETGWVLECDPSDRDFTASRAWLLPEDSL